MDKLYNEVCFSTNRLITNRYSTSFAIGVSCLDSKIRDAIFGVYGFVRVADEIVDTFHDCDKRALLEEFEREYYLALDRGVSTNPVIHAFQITVKKYDIDNALVDAFMQSMKMDLDHSYYGHRDISKYIYGSAEVVGLICLKIFVEGDKQRYLILKPYAQHLGAAFQKINFLRDMRNDTLDLHRIYFPILKNEPLTDRTKQLILDDIYKDYDQAEKGIRQLPKCARLGVYTAYLYYRALTNLIQRTPAQKLLNKRIRISNPHKAMLLCKAYLTQRFI